jgi:serine/threonine protein kinase
MTTPDLHARATALFLKLRDLPAPERESRLAAEADALVRAEVASLLAHDTHDDPTSTFGPGPGPSAPDLPAHIGPYSVVRRIGQGGSGYVLLAEQRRPIHRRVAIKIVPYAAISPDVAARFEFERRALERTDHPNIARILDAGTTESGLPYLVIEYVEGPPLTEYCRRNGLPLRDRIALMLDIADGVQHAHQRGVIHRDLKPGNILIAESGGRAMPRILDFGIAKPTLGPLDEHSPPTIGLPLGTPAYMAPEQTGGQPVDTRADVYALGAILYELAAGRPPIDPGGDAVAALNQIREIVPPPPSRVRAAHPEMFKDDAPARSLLDDLDCIAAKALEKSPARRYATVSALADDLRRLLAREPISARPPTLAYRAARFAQRNRALAAAIGIAALAILVSLSGLSWGLLQATRERREADNQSEAQREINRFLTDDLLGAASPDQQGQNTTALELLNRAGLRVDDRFPNRPLIAAAIHHSLGVAYTQLGAYDQAQTHLDRAIALRREHAGPNAPDTVRSEIAAASLLGQRQNVAEAEPALRRAIQRGRDVLGTDDPALYAAMSDLGSIYETMDRGSDAVALLKEALAGRIRLLGPHDPQVLTTTNNLAQAYDRTGQTDRSLDLMLEALRIADSLPDQPRLTILGLCNNIGATYQDLNRDKDAAPYLRRAADLATDFLGADNPDTLTIQANLAGLEAKLGDPMKAASIYDAIATARTKTLGPTAFDTLTARYGYFDALRIAGRYDEAAAGLSPLIGDIGRALSEQHWLAAQTRATLARTLFDSGKAQEALPYAQAAADQFLKLYGPDHGRTRNTTELLNSIKARLAPKGPTP